MSLNYKDGAGVTHEITALKYTDDDGDDHTITALRRGAKIIFPTASPGVLTVTFDLGPDFVGRGGYYNSASGYVPPATALPTGGTGTYASYLWEITSQSGGNPFAITTPTNVSTSFSQYPVGHFDVNTGTGTCTVTDSLGNTGVGNFTITMYGDEV